VQDQSAVTKYLALYGVTCQNVLVSSTRGSISFTLLRFARGSADNVCNNQCTVEIEVL
jgi:hypothetical protein